MQHASQSPAKWHSFLQRRNHRDKWLQPTEPIEICVEALRTLERLTGLTLPVRPNPHSNALTEALFNLAQAHLAFTDYRTGKQLFGVDDTRRSIEAMRSTLAKRGWPQDLLEDAERHCLELLFEP